jgi:cell division protein FtsQ
LKRISAKANKKNKKINISLKIIILLVIIIIAVALVLVSNTCSIKTINVIIDGYELQENIDDSENLDDTNLKISEEEIKSLSGLSIGQNMFKISKSKIIEAIKKNPYVEDVKISKKLNGTLSISVTQRQVAYLINYAGAYIYIDSEGNLLEVSTKIMNVPLLLGVTTDFSGLATQEGNELAIKKLNDEDIDKIYIVNNIMMNAKENEIDSLISSVDITNDKNYTLYLDSENKTVYLGDCKDINTRILYLKAILEKEKGNSGEIFINADLDSDSEYVYFKESV